MAAVTAAGNSPKMTLDFFTSIQTLTASIAQTVSGEASAGTVRYNALFGPRPHPLRDHAGHEPDLGPHRPPLPAGLLVLEGLGTRAP